MLHTVNCLKRSAGGSSYIVAALSEALGRNRSSVHIAAQDWIEPNGVNMIPDPVIVHTHLVRAMHSSGLRFSYTPGYQRTLSDICRHKGIHLIHDHGIWLPSNHSVVCTACKSRIPLIIQPHGMLEHWALSWRSFKKRLAWRLYQQQDLHHAALLVATSRQEADGFRQAGMCQPVAIIPNGVNMPVWKNRHPAKDGVRCALFLSRIHPKKGLKNLVAAWDRVRPERWRMVVAGPDEGHHLAEVKDAVRQAGLTPWFEFVGPVAGRVKEELFRSADLFILPTFSENFGVVVAEALSYGVPVITTKGAPWEDITAHRCGWWVDIGIEPLAAVLQAATILPNAALQEMGLRGRHYVESKFSWPTIAREMLVVYHWMLGHTAKPDVIME